MTRGATSQNQGGTGATNGGNSTAGVLTPQDQNQQQGANDGAAAANRLTGSGSANQTTPDNDDDDTPAAGQGNGAAPSGGQRSGRFRWGNTIGGVLGVIGAYLASSMFGGGWLGTIMFALFAIPAFMMGRSGLGGTLSRWMGEPPAEGQEQTRGTEVQRAQAQGATAQAQAQAAEEQITERRADLQLRAQAYANLSQRAIANRGNNRRFTDQNVAELNEQNQQIARLVQAAQNTTDPVQAGRVLDIADRYFENMYSRPRNQRMRGDMEIEMATLRGSAPAPAATATAQAGAPAVNPNMDPAIAQYYQQNYGAARAGAPMTNPQVVATNLSPEAQQQVLAMRQNYQPAPAQQGVLDAQRFSGLPDQQQYTVPDYYVAR